MTMPRFTPARFAFVLFSILCLATLAHAQRGIRGQVFLPNGSPAQQHIRFTLTTDNGMRTEIFFTDSNGRIMMPSVSGRYTITIETDGSIYNTTVAQFDPLYSGSYITVHLKPFKPEATTPPGVVNVNDVDSNVSPEARAAYDAALELLQEAKYSEALDPLKRAIELQPNYFHACNDLGVAYMKLNRLDEAAAALREAIKINHNIYLPRLNLGIVLNRQGKNKEAAEILLKLQRSHPDLEKVHAPLIEALMGAANWAEAERELSLALEIKEIEGLDPVDLKNKLGAVLIRQGKYKEAVSTLGPIVVDNPDHALAQFNLGGALLEMGDFDRAEAPLRRAYQLRGARMPGAQLMLGQLFFKKKDYPKAIQAFETYLRDFPAAPNAAQVQQAIDKLRRALNAKPE
jgi:Flp pilus assembly protein TadD